MNIMREREIFMSNVKARNQEIIDSAMEDCDNEFADEYRKYLCDYFGTMSEFEFCEYLLDKAISTY